MTEKSTKPQLRFAGFDDTWEQRKFDEVFDCTIPNNTLSRAELNYESGSVRNIHYGDILIKYGSVVDVQNDEIPFATGKSSDDFKGALIFLGNRFLPPPLCYIYYNVLADDKDSSFLFFSNVMVI